MTITNVRKLKRFFAYFSPTLMLVDSSHLKQMIDEAEWITDDEIKAQESNFMYSHPWLSSYLLNLYQIYHQHGWPIVVIPLQSYIEPIIVPLPPVGVSGKTTVFSHHLKPNPFVGTSLEAKFSPHGYVEGGVLYGELTAGYGVWFNQYLRTFVKLNKKNSINLELAHDYEFNQHGDYAVLQQVHTINDYWYTQAGAGVSNSSIFVPKYYVGGAVFRRLMSQGQLVSYLGAHAYWWRPVASTEDLNPGLIYYFAKPWVMELGGFINRSNPGRVYSASAYAVLTEGKEKEHFYSFRFGFGREAYLPLGPNVPGVEGFRSMVATATWRQWIGKNWGTNIVGETYNNKYYQRYGLSLGLFMDFSI